MRRRAAHRPHHPAPRLRGPAPVAAIGLALCVVALPAASRPERGAPSAGQAPSTDIHLARLEIDGARIVLLEWTNATARDGYDNQPSFTPDGAAMLYTSERGGQTDTYRYELATGRRERVTATPESEYSPTAMPGGARFSAVRVEADSTQRLWSFRLDGGDPALVLPDIAPVGYHAWVDEDRVALYVLGSPPTLQLADRRTGGADTVAAEIGRSLQRVPGGRLVSFVDRSAEPWWLAMLDPERGAIRRLVATLEGSEDHAWTPGGIALMGSGSRLYAFDPTRDEAWRPVADLAEHGIGGITRIAVAPDGSRLAVVSTPAPGGPP